MTDTRTHDLHRRNQPTIIRLADEPVTFLLFFTPGGFENYFDDVAQLLAAESAWPPGDMCTIRRIVYDHRPA